MEFVELFKLTDVKQIESLGLDRMVLAKQVADTFLRQIVETAYFHADPHSRKLWKMKGLGTIRFEAGTGGKYVKGIPLQQQQCSSGSKIFLKASNPSIMMVMVLAMMVVMEVLATTVSMEVLATTAVMEVLAMMAVVEVLATMAVVEVLATMAMWRTEFRAQTF